MRICSLKFLSLCVLAALREKTKVYNARACAQTLDFLGYSFGYDTDLHGRPWRYWNLFPSAQSMRSERDKLKEMTDPCHCFNPLRKVIKELHIHLDGWANYYCLGYPRKVFWGLNRYVRLRLETHVKRRSQRGYHLPNGKTFYAHFADLGLKYLKC